MGRHFPHPGRVDHLVPEAARIAEKVSEVPSEQNGFAGLPRGTKVVVVQPGDCLSVLAERHLGDWRLDSEIEALNYGRLQPDGRALVDDHWIYVGWVLVMPPDAVGTIVVGGSTRARPPENSARPPERKDPHTRETPATAVSPHRVDPAPLEKTTPSSPTTTRFQDDDVHDGDHVHDSQPAFYQRDYCHHDEHQRHHGRHDATKPGFSNHKHRGSKSRGHAYVHPQYDGRQLENSALAARSGQTIRPTTPEPQR